MDFRRNLPSGGKTGGRLIVLTIVAAFLIVGGLVLSRKWITMPSEHTLKVQQLDTAHFLINGDTTFSDNFASVIIDSVRKAKQQYNYIRIKAQSPHQATAAQIADFIQVIQALDDGRRVSINWVK